MSGVRRIGTEDDLRELPIMRGRGFRPIQTGPIDLDSCARKSKEARPGPDNRSHRMIQHVRITWSTTSGESGSVRLPRFEAAEYIRALIYGRYGRRTLRIKCEPA